MQASALVDLPALEIDLPELGYLLLDERDISVEFLGKMSFLLLQGVAQKDVGADLDGGSR